MTGADQIVLGEPPGLQTFLVRGQQVILGVHLAEIYELDPAALDLAVERHIGRFPEGAVFRLSQEEFAGLQSRFAIPGQASPYAFTGQGVAMLSGFLFDERMSGDNQETCAPTCSCRS